MDVRKKVCDAGLGIVLVVILCGLEVRAAETQAKETATATKVAVEDTKAVDTKPTGKDTKEPGEKAPKERGSETAAPLLERTETGEAKEKRLRYARAMKTKQAAAAKMDAAYVKAVVEREQAHREAEKAKKTRQETPANEQENGSK